MRFTDALALEVQAHGIRVFAIHPGLVKTPMLDFTMESAEVRQGAPHIQDLFRAACAAGQDTPLERPVELVLQLAAGLGDALSGRYISVDDDLTALVHKIHTSDGAVRQP